jgi:hypothetical protein
VRLDQFRRRGKVTDVNGITRRSEDLTTRLRQVAERATRIALSGVSRRATSAAQMLRRKVTKFEIRVEGLDSRLSVKAIRDIPAPQVDLGSADPIAAIMASAVSFAICSPTMCLRSGPSGPAPPRLFAVRFTPTGAALRIPSNRFAANRWRQCSSTGRRRSCGT